MIHIKLDKKAKDVISKTADLGSGSIVVNELPQVGEEHIIYELQEKKKVPSWIPIYSQQMVDDGVSNEIMLFVLVFDTSEDMTNTFTSVIPEGEIPFYINYIIKEDKLIMSGYVDADWQFAEVTKVSDYKFDLSNVFGGGSSAYLVMLKEYLGKSSEEGEAVKYAGKLLNNELYAFEPNTFGVLLGAPTSGIMALNSRFETAEIPVEVLEEYTFEYIPYEKIIKNQLLSLNEGANVMWLFKPKGIGEVTLSSYWIYANKSWFNADEIKPIKLQDKNVESTADMPVQEITADEGYDGLGIVTVTRAIGATYTISALSTTLPKALSSMGVAQVGSEVYLFGGKLLSAWGDTIYKFNTETETVTTLSVKLPKRLYSMGVTQVGGNIYLFGGDDVGSVVNTIYKFNTDTETLTRLSTTLPQGMENMGIASVGSNVYLFGGYSSGSGSSYENIIYKFDTETETISTLSVTLPQGLRSMGSASVGNNIYLFGGAASYISNVNTILKFNTETETISELSAILPKELCEMAAAQIGSNVYLFGGNSESYYKNTIYKFNAETETVTTLSATLPKELDEMGAASVGSNVYLFGGYSDSASYSNSIYKFKVDF